MIKNDQKNWAELTIHMKIHMPKSIFSPLQMVLLNFSLISPIVLEFFKHFYRLHLKISMGDVFLKDMVSRYFFVNTKLKRKIYIKRMFSNFGVLFRIKRRWLYKKFEILSLYTNETIAIFWSVWKKFGGVFTL